MWERCTSSYYGVVSPGLGSMGRVSLSNWKIGKQPSQVRRGNSSKQGRIMFLPLSHIKGLYGFPNFIIWIDLQLWKRIVSLSLGVCWPLLVDAFSSPHTKRSKGVVCIGRRGGYFYPFFFSHHTIGMLGLEENHLRAGKLKAVR